MFPEGADYAHDKLDQRHELRPEQRAVEPANADSHLAFIAGGLQSCVLYNARRPGPVFFVDLDGTYNGTPRKRATTMVGFNREEVVARGTLDVPVSGHAVDAVNLKDQKLGLYEQIGEFIEQHGVTKGRVRLELGARRAVRQPHGQRIRDVADAPRPGGGAAQPAAVRRRARAPRVERPARDSGKAMAYAKYDLVYALNKLVDKLRPAVVDHRAPARAHARSRRVTLLPDGSRRGSARLRRPHARQGHGRRRHVPDADPRAVAPGDGASRRVDISLTRFL